jgi:hypothetical protein
MGEKHLNQVTKIDLYSSMIEKNILIITLDELNEYIINVQQSCTWFY